MSQAFTDGVVYQEYLGDRIALPFVFLISDGQVNGEKDVKKVTDRLFSTWVGNRDLL